MLYSKFFSLYLLSGVFFTNSFVTPLHRFNHQLVMRASKKTTHLIDNERSMSPLYIPRGSN